MDQQNGAITGSLDLAAALREEFLRLHPDEQEKFPNTDTGKVGLSALVGNIHELKRPHTALCLSGGGIRSATFGLGLIQGMARHGLLQGFDYLSTVSGGGYIGGWLSAWINRDHRGLGGVVMSLNQVPSVASTTGAELSASTRESEKIDPEPSPLQHLRAYSNYLSPHLGFFTPDGWSIVAIYLRNLLLNWVVLLPFLAVVLLVPRLFMATVSWPSPVHWLAPLLALVVAVLGVVCTMAYTDFHRPSLAGLHPPPRNDNFARADEGRFLRYAFCPPIVAVIAAVFFGVWARHSSDFQNLMGWVPLGEGRSVQFGTLGALMVLTGWLVHFKRLRPAKGSPEAIMLMTVGFVGGALLWNFYQWVVTTGSQVGTSAGRYALYACLAGPLLLGLLFVVSSLLIGLASSFTTDEDREWWARAGAWVLLAAVSWAALSALVLFGPYGLMLAAARAPKLVASSGVLSGLAAVLLGRSGATSTTQKSAKESKTDTLAAVVTALAAPFFVVLLLAFLALGLFALINHSQFASIQASFTGTPAKDLKHWWPAGYFDSLFHTSGLHLFVVTLVAASVSLLASSVVNANKFSMHAMYRNRLIRAYLGASRRRNLNLFADFQPDDNLPVVAMDGIRLRLSSVIAPKALFEPLWRVARAEEINSIVLDVWKVLAPAVQEQIKRLPKPEDATAELIEQVCPVLNQLIEGPALEVSKFESERIQEEGGAEEIVRKNRACLEEAFPGAFRASVQDVQRPFHVLNMTLNLTGGGHLAWQERQAESFTISPLHGGSLRLGYRSSGQYSRRNPVLWTPRLPEKPTGLTLGTAVTISGAAASPNMGYHSSPVVAFLLTLFNVRLGWWLGNPGKAGDDTFRNSSPKSSLRPLLGELLGQTDDRSDYVMVSDGGHFEKLGLYEMVLRRCKIIIVSDAGEDPAYSFEDLSNALVKIRTDLGVPIEFTDQIPIAKYKPKNKLVDGSEEMVDPSKNELGGRYCALAIIRYSAVDTVRRTETDQGEASSDTVPAPDGLLIYLKPTIIGKEPADLLHYVHSNPAFPHEPTLDEFYSESQFEAYRLLGEHLVGNLCGQGWQDDVKGIDEQDRLRRFAKRALAHVKGRGSDPSGDPIQKLIAGW